MPTLYRWPSLGEAARAQIDRFVAALCERLQSNLVGIYLHGSCAMGTPSPIPKDIDLVVVTHAPLAVETKLALADLLLAHSGAPSDLELHVLTREQLHPWRHPAPFDFHYSEGWRERFEQGEVLALNPGNRPDRDLAAHITILNHRGISLVGPSIATVFPAVAPADYRDALLYDFASARDGIATDPVYGVLNLCRVYGYLKEGLILSKEEGGLWGAETLPAPHDQIAAGALAAYRGQAAPPTDAEALTAFARYVDAKVSHLLKGIV